MQCLARRRFLGYTGAVLTAPTLSFLAGCSTNPATGRSTFTGLMSRADEAEIGAQEHPQILDEFGGVYSEGGRDFYLARIGGTLGRQTETPDATYTFTLLNSPIVNAFALPGGYVYATRGLMALAGDEAELAGVIGHELGHVVARHSAQRYSQAVLAGGLGAVLGIVVGSAEVSRAADIGAGAYLAGFSRENELEADMLGVRYLAKAGYDPNAMSSFLARLGAHSALESKLLGQDGADGFDFFASHPRTQDRVSAAIVEARAFTAARPTRHRDVFLGQMDRMLYGDDPAEGVARGLTFSHPALRFRFTVPRGYRLINGRDTVQALHPDGARLIFDLAPGPYDGSMVNYLRAVWGRDIPMTDLQGLTIDGLDAATAGASATSGGRRFVVHLAAIRGAADRIYRFLHLLPSDKARAMQAGARDTVTSFRRLSQAEAAAIRPLRLAVRTAVAGDTVDRLAAAMPFDDFTSDRFRTLNGLGANQTLVAGQLYKTVVEAP
ncbi:MAG: M48 family metalloprotease [Alphaproteobacteria bacterium]